MKNLVKIKINFQNSFISLILKKTTLLSAELGSSNKCMKKVIDIIKAVLVFLLILFIVFFSIVNSEFVKINFDFFPFNFVAEVRVFLLVIFCFALGFLCGTAATGYNFIIKYFENLKNKKRVRKLEDHIKSIENNNGGVKENG